MRVFSLKAIRDARRLGLEAKEICNIRCRGMQESGPNIKSTRLLSDSSICPSRTIRAIQRNQNSNVSNGADEMDRPALLSETKNKK